MTKTTSPRLRPVQCVVGFIDLLGTSDAMRNAHAITDLEPIYERLLAVRKHFDYRPKSHSTRQAQRAVGERVLAFADCIIVAVPIHSAHTKSMGEYDAICEQLYLLALSQFFCVINTAFVRGGVAEGPWLYRQRAELVLSPAFVVAHDLEAQIKWPVLAVDPGLYSRLKGHSGRGAYAPYSDPLNWLFKEMKASWLTPSKTLRFLDYLGIGLEAELEAGSTQPRRKQRQGARRLACLHRDAIVNAYHSVADAKVRRKYRWLARYHNQVIDELDLGKSSSIGSLQ